MKIKQKSTGTDSERTQLDEDTKIFVNIPHMFKEVEESMSVLRRDVENVKVKKKKKDTNQANRDERYNV